MKTTKKNERKVFQIRVSIQKGIHLQSRYGQVNIEPTKEENNENEIICSFGYLSMN